jgi:hypothetical protein
MRTYGAGGRPQRIALAGSAVSVTSSPLALATGAEIGGSVYLAGGALGDQVFGMCIAERVVELPQPLGQIYDQETRRRWVTGRHPHPYHHAIRQLA